jgi:hypothetical protein
VICSSLHHLLCDPYWLDVSKKVRVFPTSSIQPQRVRLRPFYNRFSQDRDLFASAVREELPSQVEAPEFLEQIINTDILFRAFLGRCAGGAVAVGHELLKPTRPWRNHERVWWVRDKCLLHQPRRSRALPVGADAAISPDRFKPQRGGLHRFC